MRTIVRMLAVLAAALCCANVYAQIPHKVNYQGYLTAAGGTPVTATLSMQFNLYAVDTGGVALYSETQSIVVTNGVFNAVIGTPAPIPGSVPFDQPYYLGIAVGGDAEMTPRQFVAAAPYAIRAASTDALAASATVPGSQITGAISNATATISTANLSGTIATAQLAAGAVTAAKMASNGCSNGHILKYNGTSWACAPDDYFSLPGAPVGQVLVGTGASYNWSGSPSLSGNLTLASPSTASTGTIMKGGSTFIHNFGASNTFVGEISGNFTMGGNFNSAFGTNTLQYNTFGYDNTAIGTQAMQNNQSGYRNTGIGTYALLTHTGGFENTAVGHSALGGVQTACCNTAVGVNALLNNTGASNTALGRGAGALLTTGTNNIMIGNSGVAGESNTIRIGDPAVQTRTVLVGTVGIGGASSLDTRLNVVAPSPKATAATTRAVAITTNDAANPFALDIKMLGAAALANRGAILQTTDWNLGDGGSLLLQPQAGNVGVGTTNPVDARLVVQVPTESYGLSVTDGTVKLNSKITAAGAEFGVYSNHPLVFVANGFGIYTTDVVAGVGQFRPSVDGTVRLGTAASRFTELHAINGTIQTSDARLKKAVTNLDYGLREVMQLRPVTFEWNDRSDRQTHLGLIAQEVEAIIPEAVERDSDPATALGMSYTSLVPVLIKAVQEQQSDIVHKAEAIAALRIENTALRTENTALRAQNVALDARVAAIELALRILPNQRQGETVSR